MSIANQLYIDLIHQCTVLNYTVLHYIVLHYNVVNNTSLYCTSLYYLQDCDARARRSERSIGGRGTTGGEGGGRYTGGEGEGRYTGGEGGGRYTGGEPLGVLQTARLTVEEQEEATDFQDNVSVTVMMPGEGVGGQEQEVSHPTCSTFLIFGVLMGCLLIVSSVMMCLLAHRYRLKVISSLCRTKFRMWESAQPLKE